MSIIAKLFRPLDYLRIKHSEKLWVDYYAPLVMTFLFIIFIYNLPLSLKIFGDKGLIEIITGILQILTGFYIASLAAISTFNKKGMDDIMPGEPPTLKVSYRGSIRTDRLTRRRFLCLMFGYLAYLSLILYFLGETANLIKENAMIIVAVQYHAMVKWVFVSIYLFLSNNLIITTLLGLYYMVDRIHRSDPKAIEKTG